MTALLLAGLSGILMALQGSLNSALSKVVGLGEATLLVHALGTVGSSLLFAFGLGQGTWQKLKEAPWYSYLGGFLGVAIVYLVVASISKTGVAAATTAIIVGQVSTAALVDYFGWFGLKPLPFTVWQGLGLLLMAGGAWLLLSRGQ